MTIGEVVANNQECRIWQLVKQWHASKSDSTQRMGVAVYPNASPHTQWRSFGVRGSERGPLIRCNLVRQTLEDWEAIV